MSQRLNVVSTARYEHSSTATKLINVIKLPRSVQEHIVSAVGNGCSFDKINIK